MIVMHSLFDLIESCSVSEFQHVVNLFIQDLKEKDLLISSRFMCNEPHDGYNADGPSTTYYLAVEFIDMSQAEACWAYVESDDELVKALHDPLKSSVQNSSFFLYRDIL